MNKKFMNEKIVHSVLQEALSCGVREFIICAGMRNSPFIEALRLEKRVGVYYWPEERSAAFFGFGRIIESKNPVAVIVTSGTAAAELLPAAMNAYYLSLPLLLITADRPHSFRGSGAPQSAEQVELFKNYTSFMQDINASSLFVDAPSCELSKWDKKGVAHLNVCLNEPQSEPYQGLYSLEIKPINEKLETRNFTPDTKALDYFLSQTKNPLVIVSTLSESNKEAVIKFLVELNAPLFLEGISGLREEKCLQHLKICKTDRILESAKESLYPIDGILRIGGIPTHRIWRDLEYLENQIAICHITEAPFSGLSWHRSLICAPIEKFLSTYPCKSKYDLKNSIEWLQKEKEFETKLLQLFKEEPKAETSLIHALSKQIPIGSHVYLGNSLPVREWDMAATTLERRFSVTATRGSLNGIDGQISTFLGMAKKNRENFAILGDLTTLYDMMGPWILKQLPPLRTTFIVINNGGGKFFERFSPHKEMLNAHGLSFKPLAEMWELDYSRLTEISEMEANYKNRLIEIIPDDIATKRFWDKYKDLN